MDIFNYSRRQTSEVNVGGVPMGSNQPIRIQSMTNVATQDVEACVEQIKRIVNAGGEYVRLTAQGIKEAECLKEINIGIRKDNIMTPLVADIHFNPKVADVAAKYVEKVRINPGNYVDAARTFKKLEFTEEEYQNELKKIEERFVPFLNICKENHTAIRIGVNFGSLSDRIMSRYGNTPDGVVESCMEFLRICNKEDFKNVVISIKSSNTILMATTVRHLIATMEEEKMFFPVHLGVTEAGEGEDGRIKSAFGIGALLADGIGDTVRVSLSEAPEAEIPVAKKLVDYISVRKGHPYIPCTANANFSYLNPKRRATKAVRNIGGNNVPVVLADRMNNTNEPEQENSSFTPDYIYVGENIPTTRNKTTGYIVDAPNWKQEENTYPAFNHQQLHTISGFKSDLKFLFLSYMMVTEEVIACLKYHPEVVVISQSNHINRLGEHRALVHQLMNENISNPVIFFQHYTENTLEDFQIKSAADCGPLILDGLCDGIYLHNNGNLSHSEIDSTSFSILQAGRLRTSKTEYISCPGCGRTLYNLEKTISKVKAATSHLKGLKIGIMGCIVNGPGEMADADYGYVGAGRGKISLYKGKECVEKNIPEDEAVERLLAFIKKDRED